MDNISKEASDVLREIIENEESEQYWKTRFDMVSKREEAILRGCFKELTEKELIRIFWGDGIPYIINVLKDGYMYYEYNQNKSVYMSKFEEEMANLLKRTKNIKSPINAAPISININEYNRPSVDWVNDFEIFFNKYLKGHSLAPRIKNILFHRKVSAYNELVSCLTSISRDEEFIITIRGGF